MPGANCFQTAERKAVCSRHSESDARLKGIAQCRQTSRPPSVSIARCKRPSGRPSEGHCPLRTHLRSPVGRSLATGKSPSVSRRKVPGHCAHSRVPATRFLSRGQRGSSRRPRSARRLPRALRPGSVRWALVDFTTPQRRLGGVWNGSATTSSVFSDHSSRASANVSRSPGEFRFSVLHDREERLTGVRGTQPCSSGQ